MGTILGHPILWERFYFKLFEFLIGGPLHRIHEVKVLNDYWVAQWWGPFPGRGCESLQLFVVSSSSSINQSTCLFFNQSTCLLEHGMLTSFSATQFQLMTTDWRWRSSAFNFEFRFKFSFAAYIDFDLFQLYVCDQDYQAVGPTEIFDFGAVDSHRT